MPRFAANLSMMFTEHDFLDRFDAAAKAGFDAVEYLFPYDYPAETLAGRLQANGLDQVLFNMPPGDWDKGERGIAALPGREAEFRSNLAKALDYAATLKAPRIHAMAGLVPQGGDLEAMRQTFKDNVAFATAEAARQGIDVLIEPINNIDIPGYFLNDFDLAIAIIEEIEKDGGPAPGLQFDIYHCARIHGDVMDRIRASKGRIRHFQIAGIPDRHEPDHGDLDYRPILTLIDEILPDLAVGCEYRPAAATVDGLGWMRNS
jgi:hydroxypyruvate isomerase